jgi:hypothetical protein
VFIAGSLLNEYANGRPPKIYVNDQLVEDPSFWLKLVTGCLPLAFVAVGLFCILYWLRAKIEIEGDGIVAYGITGKPTFDARWKDVTHYRVESDGDGGNRIVLDSPTQTLKIEASTPRWQEIKTELDSALKGRSSCDTGR